MNLITSNQKYVEQEPQYLTSDEVLEFQTICEKNLNLNLSLEEAREQGFKLALAFDLMLDNLDIIDNDKN
jgi:hypothetical protein